MGNQTSNVQAEQFAALQKQVSEVQQNLQTLQDSFSTSLQGFALKTDMDAKMNQLEEKGESFTKGIEELLEASKENQTHIEDLKNKYSALREEQDKPNPLTEIMEKFELRLTKYEEELAQMGEKTAEIEKNILPQEEITKALGIMKTENMIKKEPRNTRRNKKASTKRSPVIGDEIEPKLTRGRAALLKNSSQENVENNELESSHSNFVNAL